MSETYLAVTDKAIPGGTGGFPLTLRGCAQERDRIIAIAKAADEKLAAAETQNARQDEAFREMQEEMVAQLAAARHWIWSIDNQNSTGRLLANIDAVLARVSEEQGT